jgi:hypothetical protein
MQWLISISKIATVQQERTQAGALFIAPTVYSSVHICKLQDQLRVAEIDVGMKSKVVGSNATKDNVWRNSD